MLRFRRADAMRRSRSTVKLTKAPRMVTRNRRGQEARAVCSVLSRVLCEECEPCFLLSSRWLAFADMNQKNGTTTSMKRLACTESSLGEGLTAKECDAKRGGRREDDQGGQVGEVDANP